MRAAVGWSTRPEAARAGKEAAENALARLPSARSNLALVFASSWFDQAALLQAVRAAVGPVPLMGGSTAGEITAEGPRSHSCVVLLIASDELVCSLGTGEGVDRDAREAGRQAAYMAVQGFHGRPRRGFLLFGDGLATNYGDAIRGIQEALGTGSLIIGGLAGDDLRFAQTYQYAGDRVLTHTVTGVLIGGGARIGAGLEHGFAPISKPRRITRARANVLYELDRKPAASVYEEYFGPALVQQLHDQRLSRQRIAFPLGIQVGESERWLLRNVLSLRDDGGLRCNGEMPEGEWLQLMIGSREPALEAARSAAQQAIRSLNQVAAVLLFDSAVRRTLLGPQHAAMEVGAIRQVVGSAIPLAGCYTYGEQAPSGSAVSYGPTVIQTGSVLVIALGT